MARIFSSFAQSVHRAPIEYNGLQNPDGMLKSNMKKVDIYRNHYESIIITELTMEQLREFQKKHNARHPYKPDGVWEDRFIK